MEGQRGKRLEEDGALIRKRRRGGSSTSLNVL